MKIVKIHCYSCISAHSQCSGQGYTVKVTGETVIEVSVLLSTNIRVYCINTTVPAIVTLSAVQSSTRKLFTMLFCSKMLTQQRSFLIGEPCLVIITTKYGHF